MSLVVLAEFVAGYLVILATPGPNIFAVAGMASASGIRGAAPFCVGLALGGGALCAAMAVAAHAEFRPDKIMRFAAAGLLVWVATRIARGRVRETARTRLHAMAACGAGFATAATSPLSAAYFLSTELYTGTGQVAQIVAPIMVALTAGAFYLLVASVLATSAARKMALRWDRPIRYVATAVIASMAARMAWPLLVG